MTENSAGHHAKDSPHVPASLFHNAGDCKLVNFCCYLMGFLVVFFFFLIQRFELRTDTLSHSTSPFCVMGFIKIGSLKLFA
jgi:hypothetical protein